MSACFSSSKRRVAIISWRCVDAKLSVLAPRSTRRLGDVPRGDVPGRRPLPGVPNRRGDWPRRGVEDFCSMSLAFSA